MPTSSLQVGLTAARAENSAVVDSDIDLGEAESELVQHGRAEGMCIGDDELSRITYLFAGAEACSRKSWRPR